MSPVNSIQYFLGANSPTGFYSLYDQLLPPEQASAIYILKGGPGCGKSTLMRRVAALAQEAGEPVEYILCSGDPDSLDAILLPGKKAALVDGTAPHVVEPKYPGVVEQYINLGKCYDHNGMEGLRTAIISCMRGYKGHYQRAYRCLDAAAELMYDVRSTLDSDALEEKLSKRARGILDRELKPRKGAPAGTVKQRFLGAVTHRGQMCLWGTVECQCQRIYELSDRYGLAHRMLAHLLSGALKAGYDVVACPSPMGAGPAGTPAHPPALPGLSFLLSGRTPTPGKAYRRLLLDNAVSADLLRRSRPRAALLPKDHQRPDG